MTTARAALGAASLLAAALLAACGVPTPGSAEPSTSVGSASTTPSEPNPLGQQLSGRSFETTGPADVTGYDLVPGSALTLSFYADHEGRPAFGGDAGCNSMGGPAYWDGNTVRAADDFAQTEMACDGLMDQEAWWSALLRGGVSLALDGDALVVTAPGATSLATPITIWMTDSALLHPDVPIGGGTWRLDGIITGSGDSAAVSSVPNDIVASLTISADPSDGHLRIDVFDGLNWMAAPGGYDGATGEYTGTVTVEPHETGIPPLEATAGTVQVTGGMAGNAQGCANGGTSCFVPEMMLLATDFTFTVHRDTLTVTGLRDTADQGLMFVLDPDAPKPDLPTGKLTHEPTDNPLVGHTFALVSTMTDDGGEDHKHPDASLILTFGIDSVTATGSCGDFSYPDVSYSANADDDLSIDLGWPDRRGCVIGDDPTGPPEGSLWVGYTDDGEMYLSTGYVAWYFSQVG